jgi:tetratricopeptide (TPR) repeat protein
MKEPPAAPGSIAEVVARLTLWCTRSDHGFIRITFDDGRARDVVVRQLQSALQGKVAAFHRLDLPRAATPQILAQRLEEALHRLGPGVVSITGIEASLPPTAQAADEALRSLNAAREAFVVPGQHTLWWFPRHLSQALIRQHHDLNSWFLKRADLNETVSSPDEKRVDEQWEKAIRLKDAAQYEQAITIATALLEEEEKRLGPDHPRVATALNNLAQLLHDTNRLNEAEPLMRRALEIDEASYGPQHPEVASMLNNLATLLHATNRLGEAEPLMRRALEIDEVSFGPQHPRVAVCLNILAQLLQATNRLGEAEPLMRRALEIDEANYGPQHPKVSIRLNNLAALLHETNRQTEAEPLMRQALVIDETSFGPQHPRVARNLNNLAQLLKAMNRLAEAEPLMRRAAGIFVHSLGLEHPDSKIALNNYCLLLASQKRTPEEIEKQVRALLAETAAKANEPGE